MAHGLYAREYTGGRNRYCIGADKRREYRALHSVCAGDVYKRQLHITFQVLYCPSYDVPCIVERIPEYGIPNSFLFYGFATVSYTHLDVYKRQGLFYAYLVTAGRHGTIQARSR